MLERFVRLAVAALALGVQACVPPYLTTEADLARGRFAPPGLAANDSLVVASYNIRFGERIDEALRDLRGDAHLSRADILLLQEMDPGGCERIARELGYDFVYYPASIHPHHDRPFGNAVLSRAPIDGAGFVPLPRPSGLSGTARIAVTAELDRDGRRLHAMSLHASTRILPLRDRLDQVRSVLDRAGGLDGPVIIGGDFNTTDMRDTLMTGRLMRRAGFHASHRRGEPTIPLTWRSRLINCRTLDHLYVRGLVVRRAGVMSGARASDHFPIWAVYEWPPAAQGPAAASRAPVPVSP